MRFSRVFTLAFLYVAIALTALGLFVVRLPMSDVTSTNPVTTSGGTTQ